MASKEQIEFWLNRRIRELERQSEGPSHEGMAEAGMSYEERQRAVQAAEKRQEDRAAELEAYREALDLVRTHPRFVGQHESS